MISKSRAMAVLLAVTVSAVALSGVQTDGWAANNQAFDYIVVGGGLGGFAVAGRLSEDPGVTVLVIEAGRDTRRDEVVYDAYKYGDNFDQNTYPDIWWNWPAVNGHGLMGGRGLGGSTSVNGMTYTRGQKAQYDALADLLGGNSNGGRWNWDGMFAAMKKAESFSGPNDVQRAHGANAVWDHHGYSGPVHVTFPSQMYGQQQQAFRDVCADNFSMRALPDAAGGDAAVVSFFPNTITWWENDRRSSSVEAYYTPVESQRQNMAVLVNHRATKIHTEGREANVRAVGVEFVDGNGQKYNVWAHKEVIVSAGAINTPVLLQLSGIGDSGHLSSLGIDTVVNLPGVGKNLQEQTMNIVSWTKTQDDPARSLSNVIAYPDMNALFGGKAASIAGKIRSQVSSYAADAVAAGALVSQHAAEFLLGAQADLMTNKGVGLVELFFDNGGYNIMAWNLLPFARGSVRIESADPLASPRLDTRCFEAEADRTIQVQGARMARQIFKAAPLRNLVSNEAAPNDKVPDDDNGGSDDSWWNWINDTWMPVNHPIATCSMMLEEYGGVVDANLRVYHTQNLRIVDASVLPHQLSAHLSATLYGVAENAADIIKAGL